MAERSSDRLLSGSNDWHEGRMIDVHVYIDRDGREGWSAAFGRGLSLEERRALLTQAAALLASGDLPEEPPPQSRP
jgi:hypothetical protein